MSHNNTFDSSNYRKSDASYYFWHCWWNYNPEDNFWSGATKDFFVKQVFVYKENERLKLELEKSPLDQDVTVKFGGEDKDIAETQAFLGQAFGLSLLLMVMILMIQFNSLLHVS